MLEVSSIGRLCARAYTMQSVGNMKSACDWGKGRTKLTQTVLNWKSGKDTTVNGDDNRFHSVSVSKIPCYAQACFSSLVVSLFHHQMVTSGFKLRCSQLPVCDGWAIVRFDMSPFQAASAQYSLVLCQPDSRTPLWVSQAFDSAFSLGQDLIWALWGRRSREQSKRSEEHHCYG